MRSFSSSWTARPRRWARGRSRRCSRGSRPSRAAARRRTTSTRCCCCCCTRRSSSGRPAARTGRRTSSCCRAAPSRARRSTTARRSSRTSPDRIAAPRPSRTATASSATSTASRSSSRDLESNGVWRVRIGALNPTTTSHGVLVLLRHLPSAASTTASKQGRAADPARVPPRRRARVGAVRLGDAGPRPAPTSS